MLRERKDLESRKPHRAGIYGSQRQEMKSAVFKTSENKTLSKITITRRLSNAGFVSRGCVKKAIAVSEKSQTELSCWENMECLIQSGSAELCGVINQYFSCMLTSREVCLKI